MMSPMMTPEGHLFRRLVADKIRPDEGGNAGQETDIVVYVAKGCNEPTCNCGGRPSVRLVLDGKTVECFDRQAMDTFIRSLVRATLEAWPDK